MQCCLPIRQPVREYSHRIQRGVEIPNWEGTRCRKDARGSSPSPPSIQLRGGQIRRIASNRHTFLLVHFDEDAVRSDLSTSVKSAEWRGEGARSVLLETLGAGRNSRRIPDFCDLPVVCESPLKNTTWNGPIPKVALTVEREVSSPLESSERSRTPSGKLLKICKFWTYGARESELNPSERDRSGDPIGESVFSGPESNERRQSSDRSLRRRFGDGPRFGRREVVSRSCGFPLPPGV